MQTFLAVTPDQMRRAAECRCSLAHVAYRIGPDSSLLRQNLLLQTRGGLLCAGDFEAPPIHRPEALCAAFLRECSARNYSGVLLDFESDPKVDRLEFVAQLAAALQKKQKDLFLPQSYAQAGRQAAVLVCTAVSGGNFSEYLQETAAQLGGAGRIALDLQRLRMEFALPAPMGRGTPLTEEDFTALIGREAPNTFFSQELCAKYFTYRKDGQIRFVLYDDAATLRRKLHLGATIGCRAAFLMWPEVQDLASTLFPAGRNS